jgi:hypothetical protein
VAARLKAWICVRSFTGIAGSNLSGIKCMLKQKKNLVEFMDVSVLLVLCVVRQKSLRWADPLSRGILPNVVCPSVIVEPLV